VESAGNCHAFLDQKLLYGGHFIPFTPCRSAEDGDFSSLVTILLDKLDHFFDWFSAIMAGAE